MAILNPRIGGGSPGPQAVPTAVATPNDFSAGLSGLADVSATLAQRVQEDIQIADRIRAVELKSEYRRRIEERLAGANAADPDFIRTMGEDFATGRDEVLRDHGINSPEVIDDLELSLVEIEQAGIDAAAVSRRGALKDRALADRTRLLQQTVEMIRDNPDAHLDATDDFGASMASLSAAIPPGERAALQEEAADAIIEARVEGLIKAFRYDEASILIDQVGGEITPDHRRQLQSWVATAASADATAAAVDFSREHADMRIRVAGSEDLAAIDGAIRDINRQDELGFFAGAEEKRAELMVQAINKRRAIIEKGDNLREAFTRFAAGPVSQEDTDLIAPEILKRAQAEGADLDDALVQLAHDAGHMPTPLKDIIAASGKAGNAEALARGAALHSRVKEAVPNVETGADAQVEATAMYMRDFGMPPEEAARRVIDQTPDPALRKQRDEDYKANHLTDGADWLADQGLAEDRSWWPGSLGYSVEGLAVEEANKLRREAYQLLGDIDAADKMAADAMRQRWGHTYAGGSQLQKWPAEEQFPPHTIPNGSRNVGLPVEMRGQIANELVNLRLDAGGWPAREGFTLVPTEKADRLKAAGHPVEYYVHVWGPYGQSDLIRAYEKLADGTTAPVVVSIPQDEAGLMASPTYKAHVEASRAGFLGPRGRPLRWGKRPRPATTKPPLAE